MRAAPLRTAAVLAVFLSASCAGTSTRIRARTGEGAADALRTFVAFVAAVHPDPHRFVDEATLDALVAREVDALASQASPTELEVGRAFTRVAAAYHDAHMAVALPSFRTGGNLTVLPLAVALVEDAVFVDASTPEVPLGTTVTAIDGTPITDVLGALAPLAVYEGENAAARRRAIEDGFTRLHALAFGASPTYAVTLRADDGTERVETWPAIGLDAYAALARTRRSRPQRGDASGPQPTLRLREDGTAILRMATFGVVDEGAYRARLAEHVAALASAARVVVDLRGNEGGYRTLGVALANHLVTAPYAQWQRYAVRVRAIPAAFEDLVAPAFGASLEPLATFPPETTGGLHVLEGDPLAALMQPASPHIRGQLFVLVDARTNSAANELAIALRVSRPDAVFVGEEIGGECARHVGEVPVTFTSPAYGVVALLSLVRIEHVETPGCAIGHGLLPDVAVTCDRACFLAGRDPYLDAIAP